MGGNSFSKKMCQELLLFEDYLLSCKPTLLHKDQIIIDRDRTFRLIAELRSYHCADRSPDDTVNVATLEQTAVLPQAEAEPMRRTVKKAEMPRSVPDPAPAPEPAVLSVEDAMLKEAAQAEAERIVAEAQERAKFIINEATIKADVLLKQSEEKAQEKQQQIDELLRIKISDAEKRSKDIVEKANQAADMEMETKSKQVHDMLRMSFQKADNLIEMAENIYAKQLEVVRADHQEIKDILSKLQR